MDIPTTSPNEVYELSFRQDFICNKLAAFIKQVNLFTGFGKTYNSASFSLDLHRSYGVCSLFIAPTQAIVAGFEAEIRKGLETHGKPPVPVYRIYSREFLLNDHSFFILLQKFGKYLEDRAWLLSA